MIFEKDGNQYVWMAVYTEEKDSHVHHVVFCDEAIDKKYRTKLFRLFLKENELALLSGGNKALFCVFDVTGENNQPDWDNVDIVAFTHPDSEYIIDVEFGSAFDGSDEDFRSEGLFLSSLLQCATEFSAQHFSLMDIQDKFQTYWNCLAQNIPYKPAGTHITDMDITTIDSSEPNVCIHIKLDNEWSYYVPYIQTLLENIISEKRTGALYRQLYDGKNPEIEVETDAEFHRKASGSRNRGRIQSLEPDERNDYRS